MLPADDTAVLARIAKASAYFQETIAAVLSNNIALLQIDTDNTALRKKVNNALKLLREEITVKLAAVQCCEKGFSPSDYFRVVSAAAINTEKKKESTTAPLYSEADIAHPEMFETLKAWRSRKAEDEGVAHYQVLHQKTLIQIAVNLPDTLAELKRIKGIGKRLAARYGQELADLVSTYRKQHQIEAVTIPTPDPVAGQHKQQKTSRIDTKQASLDLFENGMTLAQIADARGLVLSTIEGHMAHWVETGKVAINRLLSPEKQQTIEKTLAQMPGKSFGEIKQALGAKVSYGEIKLVQAHLKHLTSASGN
jgi:hypothetical protein